MWEQVKTYGYGGSGQNDSREEKEVSLSQEENRQEKKEALLFQENESEEIRLLDFQKHYVDDYIADKEGRLEEDKYSNGFIHIHFKFQEFLSILDIKVYRQWCLHNFGQFELILNHYYYRSNVFDSITYHSKYKDLEEEINRRKNFQFSIDNTIYKLSQYLTLTLENKWQQIYITYTNLNRSTLSLAIGHLQSILLVLKIGSYRGSDKDKIDGLMTVVSRQCKDKLPYKPFGTHYIDSLSYTQPESPIIMFKINIEFKPIKHSLNKTLNIKNIDQFKAVLRFYESNTQQDFVRLKSSSGSEDIDPNITYRNKLQLRLDGVFRLLNNLFNFSIKEDKYDPLTLNLHYYHGTKSSLLFIIKHLELLTITFKTGNNDEHDRNAIDLYLSELKDELLPLLKDQSGKVLGDYYIHYGLKYLEKPTVNTLQLKLHIILKEYQSTITKTFQLQKPIEFIRLLDYHNFLSNGYFPSSKSFDKLLSNLLYIFEQDEDDPFTLNLYYYPLSNKLDTSLIIRHFTFMVYFFKDFKYNSNDKDIFEAYQCLSSIAVKLNSLSFTSPTKPFQHHFITQYQDKLAKPLPTTNLNLHLQLLLKDSHPISNTYPLNLSSTNQLLSLLQHYSLLKDPLDPSGIEVYKDNKDLYKEITYRSKLQTSYDRVLSKLSKRVSFRVEEDPKDISNLNLEYMNLEGSDVPYAVKHLDTMMMVYKAGNTSYKDKLEVDNFVFLMREHVEEGFTSRLDPNISNRLDTIVSNPDKAKKDSENDMIRLVDSRLDDMIDGTRDGLGSLKGKDDETEDDKVSFLPRDVNAMDGRLGGASTDIPNLLEVSGNDISMMEDVD